MDKIFKFKTNSNVRVFTYTNTHDRLDFFIPLQWWRRLWCRNIKEKIQIVPKIKALIKLASVIAPTNSQSTNFIPQALKQRSASTVSIAHSQHRQPEHDQTNDSSSQQSRQALSLSLSPHSFGLYTPHDTITSKRIAISHELSWHCMFGARVSSSHKICISCHKQQLHSEYLYNSLLQIAADKNVPSGVCPMFSGVAQCARVRCNYHIKLCSMQY